MNDVRAVLIDLDGTLLDTAPDLAAGVNGMRAELGLAPLPEARVAAHVGKGADVLVHRAVTDHPDGRIADEALFQRARTAFFAHYTRANGVHARLYPYVMEGLEAMHESGLSLACVTNKPAEFTVPLLARTGLDVWLDAVVSGDTLAERKPHPAPLLHAAALMGVTAAQCVMIGDSVNDLTAARAAGMRAFLVPYGYNEGQPAAQLPADAIVADLLEAACLLRPAIQAPQD